MSVRPFTFLFLGLNVILFVTLRNSFDFWVTDETKRWLQVEVSSPLEFWSLEIHFHLKQAKIALPEILQFESSKSSSLGDTE